MSTSAPRRTVDVIDRRVGLLFGIFALLLIVALARAGYLGLFRGSALRAAADSQQVVSAAIPAARGEITDRSGIPFALSEPADVIVADPYLIVRSYSRSTDRRGKLAPLLGMTEAGDARRHHQAGHQLRKLATVSPSAAGKVMALNYNGISQPQAVERRSYPRGTELGQVLGWVGAGGHGDGLEYLFNNQLAGLSGDRAHGR